MGKSKSGGTRTYIRGRVGSDVYSIGRDAKGKKQQIVRSLAESVANPQTQAQMRGRMIMSTIAQALAVLRPIVDHSFDGAVGARGNLAEFTQRNYALIKADIAAHPSTGNVFGLVKYQERGAKRGAYIVSNGEVALPAAMTVNKSMGSITISLTSETLTIGGLKAALGWNEGDYFTFVGLSSAGQAVYGRYSIKSSLADTTAISSSNIESIFDVDGNTDAVPALDSNNIIIASAYGMGCCDVIYTKKTAQGFKHSTAVLGSAASLDYAADVALPTYPVGTEQFLNGGDIFSGGSSFSVAPASSQDSGASQQNNTPTTKSLNLSKSGSGTVEMSVGGNTIESGANVEIGATVTVTVTPESGKEATANVNGNSVSLSQSNGNFVGTFTMPNSNSTLSVNTAYTSGSDSGDGIDKD